MDINLNKSLDWLIKAYSDGMPFVAFDLETTGLESRRDRIVEIGALRFDRDGLSARFSALVNPGVPVPAEAARVHNITDEMLRGKPSLDEVMPDFLFFIRGAVLAAHNAPFDCGFINEYLREAHKRGENALLAPSSDWISPFPSLPNPVADTLVLSRETFPALRQHSLQSLAAELRIEAREAHRAEDDARICMEILIRCVKARAGT